MDFEAAPTFYRPGDSVTVTLIKGGVIAGTITDSDGRPVVNATVRAFRVRDVEGKPVSNAVQTRERFTDDRGYYRLYGLRPGAYVVSVGGRGQISGFPYLNQYEKDAPTYAPSSTRDTAAEIMVRPGRKAWLIFVTAVSPVIRLAANLAEQRCRSALRPPSDSSTRKATSR